MGDAAGLEIQQGSLREIYKAECARLGSKVNSGIVTLLPAQEKDNSQLKVLDLSKNILGKNGVVALFKVAANASGLEQLIISDNYLTNENVVQLCLMLASHPTLRLLDVSRNPISHSAGKALSKLAKTNKNLAEVKMADTLVNAALVKSIGGKAAENREKKQQQQEEEAAPRPAEAANEDEKEKNVVKATDDQEEPRQLLQHQSSSVLEPPNLYVRRASLIDPYKQSKTPLALVSPDPAFKCLGACFRTMQDREDLSSHTRLTTRKNQALAILMQACSSSEYSVFSPNTRSPTSNNIDSSSALGAATLVSLMRNVKSVAQMKSLRVLLDANTSGHPSLQILLSAAFGNPHDLFPTLNTLRATNDLERRDISRRAINLLMTSAFLDPLPAESEIRRISPRRCITGRASPMVAAPPVSFPPKQRQQWIPLYTLSHAITVHKQNNPKKEGPMADLGPLMLLLDVVKSEPLDSLRNQSPATTQGNKELLEHVREQSLSLLGQSAKKKEKEPQKAAEEPEAETAKNKEEEKKWLSGLSLLCSISDNGASLREVLDSHTRQTAADDASGGDDKKEVDEESTSPFDTSQVAVNAPMAQGVRSFVVPGLGGALSTPTPWQSLNSVFLAAEEQFVEGEGKKEGKRDMPGLSALFEVAKSLAPNEITSTFQRGEKVGEVV